MVVTDRSIAAATLSKSEQLLACEITQVAEEPIGQSAKKTLMRIIEGTAEGRVSSAIDLIRKGRVYSAHSGLGVHVWVIRMLRHEPLRCGPIDR